MSKLTPGAKWTGDISIDKQLGTVLTFNTDDKHVDKDIEITLSVQSGIDAANTASADVDVQTTSGSAGGVNVGSILGTKSTSEPSTGYYIKLQAQGSGSSQITTAGWVEVGALTAASTAVSKYFPVQAGGASISGTNTVTPSASVTGTNVTLSNINNGVSITATGGGTASASVSAASTQAGYIPNNTTLDTQTVAASSQTTTATSYISGVTLTAPSSGTRTFSITVPNGNTTATFVFNVDSSGNVTVTES